MKVLKNNWYRRAREKLFFAVLVISVSIQLPAQPGIYFDIPGQNLSEALVLFAEQADVNVIIPADMLSGHVSSPLIGPYSVVDALSALLSKSAFDFNVVDDGRSVVLFLSSHNYAVAKGVGGSIIQEGPRLESMVVSARHRDEFLHEVPMSISVFAGEDFEARGIGNFAQLSYFSGNSVFEVTRGTNSSMSAYIRGIGQDDPIAGYQTGVGVYVDGVYINRPQTPVMDIYEAERIEILRGPQGTLYGRNTIGGALKYVTRDLSDVPGGSFSLTLGSYGQQDIVIHGESPDDAGVLKLGATLASFRRDGFGENVYTGSNNYDKDIFGFRTKMEIIPSDSVKVFIAYDLTKDDSNVKSGNPLLPEEGRPVLDNPYDTEAGITQSLHPLNKNAVLASGVSTRVEWAMSDQWTFTSISASRRDKVRSAIDFISLPSQHFDTHVLYENSQHSHEARVDYKGGGIDALFGAYFLDADAMSAFEVELEVNPSFASSLFSLADVKTKSVSAFTSITFNYDQLQTTIGGRYIEDSYSARVYRDTYVAPLGSGSNVPFFGGDGAGVEPITVDDGYQVSPNFKGKRRDYGFLSHLSTSWHFAENTQVYLSFSQGYKSGSFDPRGDYTEPRIRRGFDPEVMDTYELGLKTLLYGGDLSASAIVFHNNYRDIQISVGGRSGLGGSLTMITNGADAVINGAEVDLKLLVWGSRLSLLFAAGYMDTEYTRYIDEFGLDRAPDYLFPNAPEVTASLGAVYRQSTVVGSQLLYSLSLNYRSDVSIVNIPSALNQPQYEILNVGVGWQSAGGHWQIGVHGLNILDERYVVDGYEYTQYGFITAFYGDPRTISANLKYTF